MEKVIILLKIFVFILLVVGLIYFNNSEKNYIDTEKIDNVNDLYGSCPSSRSCISPSCGLWVDSDNDGSCDRGVL